MWASANGINQCNGKYLIWGKNKDLCQSYLYAVALKHQYFFPLKRSHFPEDRDRKTWSSWGWFVTNVLAVCFPSSSGYIWWRWQKIHVSRSYLGLTSFNIGWLLPVTPSDTCLLPKTESSALIGVILAEQRSPPQMELAQNSAKIISCVMHQEKWPHCPSWIIKSRRRAQHRLTLSSPASLFGHRSPFWVMLWDLGCRPPFQTPVTGCQEAPLCCYHAWSWVGGVIRVRPSYLVSPFPDSFCHMPPAVTNVLTAITELSISLQPAQLCSANYF